MKAQNKIGLRALMNRVLRPALFKYFLPQNPVSRHFGFERGRPLDRYYIDRFFEEHRARITGQVLETGGTGYALNLGCEPMTATALVLSAAGGPHECIADLDKPESFPENSFDCFICPQTFQYVHHVEKAVQSVHRLLKPGGIFLGTVPALSQKSTAPGDPWSDQWRFSRACMERVFSKVFGPHSVEVKAYGNVRVASAFLYGLSQEDIAESVLEYHDPDYECLVTIYAAKNK